ncbi:SDR family NAD(P)-dependent oxidoreductase [Schumannella soli]|uniref:SDR family NAD(P)-dependent oxidoreductase n=1 Tax=Schumannella soli TaxID=2590779 RepID=UPI0021040AC5|nr:SDR family NAD(P)-dependent oxidoreductase [Schumannella soli]
MTDADALANPRTVLITGTSSGIGLHTAIGAARTGWRVVATLRDANRDRALRTAADEAGVELDVRALDVTHPTAAQELVDRVVADHGSLDAVVNNAGTGKVGTTETLPISEFQDALETNFLSVVRVTQAALPHLRAARGRVLTVTSVGGVVGQPFDDAYCAA